MNDANPKNVQAIGYGIIANTTVILFFNNHSTITKSDADLTP